jgi:hypothetical protein
MKLLIAITALVVHPHGTPFRPFPGMKKAASGWRQRGSEADITDGLIRCIFLLG